MTDAESATGPKVDEVWRRRTDGKALVRIGRVWHGAWTGVEDDYVRCHPVRGGRRLHGITGGAA